MVLKEGRFTSNFAAISRVRDYFLSAWFEAMKECVPSDLLVYLGGENVAPRPGIYLKLDFCLRIWPINVELDHCQLFLALALSSNGTNVVGVVFHVNGFMDR